MLRPKPRPKTQSVLWVTCRELTWGLFRQYRHKHLQVVKFHYQRTSWAVKNPWRRWGEKFAMMKPNGSVAKGTGKLAVDDVEAWKELPRWRAFFLDQEYTSDGGERQPGLLIMRATADGWQVTLKEPSLCLMLKFTGRTWAETLLLGEALLGDPSAPWETDPYESAKRAKSRGKRG